MQVRAKFKVQSIGIQATTTYNPETKISSPAALHTVKLSPVYSNEPGSENKKFWEATPIGEITLGVINEAAGKSFELHGEYYVDFTPVPAAVAT